MWAVFWKELADHFGRRRFVLLLVTVLLGVVWGSFIDVDRLIATGAGFFFLDVFLSADSVPISLLEFLAFFGPIIGIALGFDAINGERTQGTLARLLSQPVYRDAVFNGKFLAGLTTLAIVVVSMGLSVIGVAMFPHRRAAGRGRDHASGRVRPRLDCLSGFLAGRRHDRVSLSPHRRGVGARVHWRVGRRELLRTTGRVRDRGPRRERDRDRGRRSAPLQRRAVGCQGVARRALLRGDGNPARPDERARAVHRRHPSVSSRAGSRACSRRLCPRRRASNSSGPTSSCCSRW